MVQAENEFGSYVSQRKDIPLEKHRSYNEKIKEQLLAYGIDVPLSHLMVAGYLKEEASKECYLLRMERIVSKSLRRL